MSDSGFSQHIWRLFVKDDFSGVSVLEGSEMVE